MKRLHLIWIVLCLFTQQSYAQNDLNDGNGTVAIEIPEVALVDLESSSGKNVSLVIDNPEEAGEGVNLASASDSSTWLNYSSIRSSTTDPNRSIYARIISGSVPNGLKLKVKPLGYYGSGDGALGAPVNGNGRVLNGNDRRLIKNIKSCYTGDGPGNGHQLIYFLELRNNGYKKLRFDVSNAVAVLYTISDN